MTHEQEMGWRYLVGRCSEATDRRGKITMHPNMRAAVVEIDRAMAQLRRELMAERAAFAAYRKRWPNVSPPSEGRHEIGTAEEDGSAKPRNI